MKVTKSGKEEEISCDDVDDFSNKLTGRASDIEKESTCDVSNESESDCEVHDMEASVNYQVDSDKKEESESGSLDDSEVSTVESSDDDFEDYKELKCKLCCKEFPSKHNLQRHLNLKKSTCKECSKTFCSISQLTNHMKSKHRITPFKCSQCDKQFSKKSNLKRHYSKNKCNIPCFEVTKLDINKYYTGDRDTRHPSTMSSQNVISRCNICAQKFSSKSNLKKHLAKTKQSCDVCRKPFCTKASLSIHEISFHCMNKFPCAHCPKQFSKK